MEKKEEGYKLYRMSASRLLPDCEETIEGGNMRTKTHLPLFGVGPVIVYGQVLITAVAIWLTYVFDVSFASFDALKLPFGAVGILFILFGLYLDVSAKYKSKIFKHVEENKLITDGVYAYTRNPVYSGWFLICVGAIFITNNLLLFIVPVICWMYMTIFLIKTEEVWLKELYGQEYIAYCKKVNRCIPWVPKK